MKTIRYLTIFLLASLLLTACSSASVQPSTTATAPVLETTMPSQASGVLRVLTHDSFAVSESVVVAFEQQFNAKIRFIKGGDAGTALNKAILSKNNPLADVFYGVDNTFLSRALNEGIFEPYRSTGLAAIPAEYQLDPQARALPVDYGDVCLNYDQSWFTAKSIQPPQSLEDLIKPEYKDLVVVENPATSSPGLAFLLTTIGHFGESKYLDYWENLVQNQVKVVNDWEIAYNAEFSHNGGTRPIVVSYSSSPAFEIIYATTPISLPTTAAVVGPETCFRQIEFVGILKGAHNRDLAEKWVDFMLSTTFQEDMPAQMFVFPVNPQAKLDETFRKFLAIPDKPAIVDPALIAARREQWIQDWTSAVLR